MSIFPDIEIVIKVDSNVYDFATLYFLTQKLASDSRHQLSLTRSASTVVNILHLYPSLPLYIASVRCLD